MSDYDDKLIFNPGVPPESAADLAETQAKLAALQDKLTTKIQEHFRETQAARQAYCEICGQPKNADDLFVEEQVAYCADCYLRFNGYDPDEVGRRFAAMVKRLLAQLNNEM